MWQTSMGSADLKANFGGKRHELSVSTYQMCILMLFNKTDTLCLEEIRHATQVPEQELRRHIMSLCTPKHKILKKSSKVSSSSKGRSSEGSSGGGFIHPWG